MAHCQGAVLWASCSASGIETFAQLPPPRPSPLGWPHNCRPADTRLLPFPVPPLQPVKEGIRKAVKKSRQQQDVQFVILDFSPVTDVSVLLLSLGMQELKTGKITMAQARQCRSKPCMTHEGQHTFSLQCCLYYAD